MEPGWPARALARWSPTACELWWLSRVQLIFGGTTEIMKEIIGLAPAW